MPGTKRKPLSFEYDDIMNHILSIGDKADRFLFAVSYANGTRISEALGVRAEDIRVDKGFLFIETTVLKKRRPGIVRAPPIWIAGEPWLAEIILGYVAGRRGRLIHYSKRTAQRRFDSCFDCTSHSFRHTRATHCFLVLGLSMEMVRLYFRLSPRGLTDWIVRYGHLDMEDLKGKIRGAFE